MKKPPRLIFAEGVEVDSGVREALRDVRILHKRMGVGMVGMENGKMVEIAPEDIQVDRDEAEG